PEKPKVPEMGGLAFLIGVTVASLPEIVLSIHSSQVLGILFTVIAAGIVGIVDDLYKLGALTKVLLTAVAGLPLAFMRPYSGDLTLPLGVVFHVKLLYTLAIPVSLAVVSNSINMSDVMNGAASGSSILILLALFISIVSKNFLGGNLDILLTCIMLSIILPPLLALFSYNKYPAKVFIGDTGTLAIGGALLAFSIIQSCEILLLICLLPHITNGFFNLSSMKRLFERSELKTRPIEVTEDGRIKASRDMNTPITLTRFIAALGFQNEKEILNAITALCLFSDVLAILTVILKLW
ncbi:MAG: hypothetical protein ACUVQ0_05110, partial [Thermoproteota archaeon]